MATLYRWPADAQSDTVGAAVAYLADGSPDVSLSGEAVC